jgi:hypothetical protein
MGARRARVRFHARSTTMLSTMISFALMYVLPFDRFHAVMISSYAASTGLVLFFIVIMDKPFAGSEAISPAAFEAALDGLHRWDREGSVAH